MEANLIYIFFAAGLVLSLASWIGFGLIKKTFFRVLLRTGFVSLFVTPSIIIGHGFIPAPALLVMALKGHFLIGLVPVLIVWAIGFAFVMSISKARHNKTDWPIDYASILLGLPYIRLPIYGLVFCLIVLGCIESLSDYWYFGVTLLFSGVAFNYFLSLYSSRLTAKLRWILPFLFALPVGTAGLFHFAILCSVSGLAGVLVAEGKLEKALWIGAVTSIILSVWALLRTASAIKYQNVPHIKIQGGVTLAGSTALFFLFLSILFSVIAWKSKSAQERDAVN